MVLVLGPPRTNHGHISQIRRVTIRRAQPPARLSEEICLSEGSLEASAGVSSRVLRDSAGVHGIFRG